MTLHAFKGQFLDGLVLAAIEGEIARQAQRAEVAEREVKALQLAQVELHTIIRRTMDRSVKVSALDLERLDKQANARVQDWLREIARQCAHYLIHEQGERAAAGRAAYKWRAAYDDVCAKAGIYPMHVTDEPEAGVAQDLAERYAAAECLIVNQRIELSRMKAQLATLRTEIDADHGRGIEEHLGTEAKARLRRCLESGPSLHELLMQSGPFNIWGWDLTAPPWLTPVPTTLQDHGNQAKDSPRED